MIDHLGPAPAGLAEALEDTGSRLAVRPGSVEDVMSRAGRRVARRRRLTAGMVAVTLVAGAAGIWRASSPGGDGTPLVVGGGVTRGSLGLTWQRVDPSSALGIHRGMTAGRPLYALSTAPGERHSPDGRPLSRVVWRSDDGVEWSAATKLDDDLYLADLATGDGRVYAVGTSPAAAGAGPTAVPVVGWSDDGARSWRRQPLPLDLRALAARAPVGVASTDIASGPGGTLAVVVLSARPDIRRLLPAGVTAPDGWALTDTGVDLLGALRPGLCPDGTARAITDEPEGAQGAVSGTWCEPRKAGTEVASAPRAFTPQESHGVLASYRWAELGIGGDLLKAVLGQPFAFLAAPGSTDFEPVTLPETSRIDGPVLLEAAGGGFTLVASTYARPGGTGRIVVLGSPDGRTWATGTPPAGAEWAVGLGRLGDRPALVGNDQRGAVSVHLSDGRGGWTATSLADVLASDVPAGREVGAASASFGGFGLAVHVFVHPAGGGGGGEQRILVTRDGRTFDDIDVDELAGRAGATVTRVTVLEDEVVVALALAPPGGRSDGPRPQVVVVGRA